MKRQKKLFEKIISDENLRRAIAEVNKTHRYYKHHRPNKVVLWVEEDIPARVEELRKIITEGFEPAEAKVRMRFDKTANKWREINEPKLYPDQYIHHALIQALQPVFMRGMDKHCCGSIKYRGPHYGKRYIEKWMRTDPKGTKYCAELDIRHFYKNLKPYVVMDRMRQLIKDCRTLDLIWRIVKDGVKIGFYTSQWFANVVLQPLDNLIRQSANKANHYIRYMDNFTLFHSNKRKLWRLKAEIEKWLKAHDLKLKENWQIFQTKHRMPNALGFRYGRSFTLLRKKTLFRIKRNLSRCYRKQRKDEQVPPKLANSILSSVGNFKHWSSKSVSEKYIKPGLQKKLKVIVRNHHKKEMSKWSMYSDSSQKTAGKLRTSKLSA